MARDLNKVMLIGNVGNDPEIRATSNGGRVGKISLATNRSWVHKDSGQKNERTEWHRLTIFGRLVDIVESYVKKGDRLYVEGRIEYSQTEGDGGTRYWTDIIVDEIIMLGSSSNGGSQAPRASGQASGPRVSPPGEDPVTSGPDDDLPWT